MRLPGASQTKKGREGCLSGYLYRLGQRQLAKNASTPDAIMAEVPSLEVVFIFHRKKGGLFRPCANPGCIWEGRVRRSEKLENALDNAVHDDAAAAREA